MANEKQKDQAASEAELLEAAKKGRQVTVRMPEDTTAISIGSAEYTPDKDGFVTMSVADARHAKESFGCEIISSRAAK